MPTFTVAGKPVTLERRAVEEAVAHLLPEPVQEHYVVIDGRRYPPKQVLVALTDLDRADFTTHQARRILKRLGFVAARASAADAATPPAAEGPHRGRQAAALAPYSGQWVALAGPTEVLVAAPTPEAVLAWLAKHERRAPYGMFRVPAAASEAEGAAPL
jgi:hypothetical protein